MKIILTQQNYFELNYLTASLLITLTGTAVLYVKEKYSLKMKIPYLLSILLQIVLILPVRASWLNDGVCRPNVPCVDFDDLSNLIEGCIDSGLFEISLDACSSAPVYKLRYQRHIIINSPNDITLFCSDGLSCVLRNGSDADDVIEEVRGGMFYFLNVASLHIKNVVFDGTSPSRQKKLT